MSIRIYTFISLILLSIATVLGQKSVVTKTIEPTSWGSFPVVKSIHIQGGLHTVANVTERDNIPAERRYQGMLCYVVAESVNYQLVGGVANINWTKVYIAEVKTATPALADSKTGQLLYNSTANKYQYFDGTAWQTLIDRSTSDGTYVSLATNQTISGDKIFTGGVRYVDGNQADGFVLTSDANGNATWKVNPPSVFTKTGNLVHQRVESANDRYIFGSDQINNKPGVADDTKFMFLMDLNAFRVGNVTGTEWDETNIGNNSVVIGGENNKAPFNGNVIIGGKNNISEDRSPINSSTGRGIAILGGVSNKASGNESVIVGGQGNETQKSYTAVVGGVTNKAFGMSSGVLAGRFNTNNGYNAATVGGSNNTITNAGSQAAIVGGIGLTANGNNQLVIGQYNIADPNQMFIVGGGTDDINTLNLFTVSRGTGNTNVRGILTLSSGTGDSYSLPVIRGTNGHVLTTDGTGGTSWQPVAQGLFAQTGDNIYQRTIGDDDKFIIGSDQTGNKAGTADDIRMFFDRTKGAFRVGKTNNNDIWDNANVGTNSAVVGGYNNEAFGNSAVIVGGDHNEAQSFMATVIGGNSNSVRNGSNQGTVIGGNSHVVSGSIRAAIVGGNNHTVNGSNRSVVFGGNNSEIDATSNSAIIAGDGNRITGAAAGSVILGGASNSTMFANAILGGVGLRAVTENQTIFGKYSANDNTASFLVAGGADDANRLNLFTISKTGSALIRGNLTLGSGTVNSYTLPANRGLNGHILTTDGVGGTTWQPLAENIFVQTGDNIHQRTVGAADKFIIGSAESENQAGTADNIRMFFDKTTGAFRVGYNGDDKWDDSNLGTHSAVLGGSNNMASAHTSTVLGGRQNLNRGKYASIVGGDTNSLTTQGEGAVILGGLNLVANSSHQVVLGKYNVPSFNSAFIIGGGADNANRANLFSVTKTSGNTSILGNLTLGAGTANSYTLPAARGTNGQLLITDGTGNLSWTDPVSTHDPLTLGVSRNGLSLTNQVLTLNLASNVAAGAMSTVDKVKLNHIDVTQAVDLDDMETDIGTNQTQIAAHTLLIGTKSNRTDVLEKTNTTAYTPTTDFHPATKKYVDDNVSSPFADPAKVSVYSDDTYIYTCTGDNTKWYAERMHKVNFTLDKANGTGNKPTTLANLKTSMSW